MQGRGRAEGGLRKGLREVAASNSEIHRANCGCGRAGVGLDGSSNWRAGMAGKAAGELRQHCGAVAGPGAAACAWTEQIRAAQLCYFFKNNANAAVGRA